MIEKDFKYRRWNLKFDVNNLNDIFDTKRFGKPKKKRFDEILKCNVPYYRNKHQDCKSICKTIYKDFTQFMVKKMMDFDIEVNLPLHTKLFISHASWRTKTNKEFLNLHTDGRVYTPILNMRSSLLKSRDKKMVLRFKTHHREYMYNKILKGKRYS